LQNTIHAVEFSYLFLEEKHYHHLQELLHRFGDYQVGKTILINAYRGQEAPYASDIENMVRNNGQLKEQYEALIEKVREDLRRQIRVSQKVPR
jgi:hypothetical protein